MPLLYILLFLIDYYGYNPEGQNNELITAQISDLNNIDHPFIKSGFKYLSEIYSDPDMLFKYYRFSKKINQGEYLSFDPKKKK